ncbi:ABC transporter substrate-binding protein [Paenibacillus hunanensis]|uniref:Iron complex transport system substrate-binding protein n=1 Tax=Paenibacillus hunanensis TaxID=539262 RepID=A0ABU1IWH0_9BACL|nr:ABC transporter substrate-binding protein [Paenibacillus hunanensis]MDR6243576.1 iron complex transport system substrate-binding protein [Paenibacillus hunanensis]WPP40327.1 ABC transporter substrate-binding protein [Paenibacillus hunanensis]GGI98822.1 ABC transporter substrate-binding protein [Paenibacillus hunanensis]
MNFNSSQLRWLSSIVMAAMLSVLLAACAPTQPAPTTQQPATESTESSNTSSSSNATSSAGEQTTYPLTIKDATGYDFTFKEQPKRIVSISPAETEALFALGLDQQIVGVSEYDNYPEGVKSKARIGGVSKPDVEAVVALRPDVVFTGISSSEALVKELRAAGIPIFKTTPKTIDDVISNIELYGKITNRQAEAKQVTDHMREQVKSVTDAVASLTPEQKKKVYIEFSPGWTVGKGEFMDEMITLAGGTNIAGNTTGWHEINEEAIVAADPDVILYSKQSMDATTNQTLDQIIRARSGWNKIKAIQNNQLFGLDDDLVSRPGPRVTDGLVEIAHAIYPNLFKQ